MAARSRLPYSKSEIDRAGALLRDARIALQQGDDKFFDRASPGDVGRALALVDWWRGLHARPLARVNANLRYYIRKAGVVEPDVSQRLKRFSTIVHKLERQPGMRLCRMEDIGGVRAILPNQEQVDAVTMMLQRAPRWKIRRLRQYVDGGVPGPKEDGYRAVHVILEKDHCYIELQLRTPRQDDWAQSVEQDTRRLRADLKFGAGPDDLRAYYRLVSDLYAMWDASVEPDKDFLADLAKQYRAVRQYFPD